jgi:hypothetical protein
VALVPKSIRVDVLTEPRTLWMLVEDPRPANREDLFRSNFVLGAPLHPGARMATVLYMALSMWDETGLATMAHVAETTPRLGAYAAEIELRPKRKGKPTGICIADTEPPGHWSVWALPSQLALGLVEIKPAGSLL